MESGDQNLKCFEWWPNSKAHRLELNPHFTKLVFSFPRPAVLLKTMGHRCHLPFICYLNTFTPIFDSTAMALKTQIKTQIK